MYIPGFGSASTALHLIAKYPMGALVIGALSLSAYLSPSTIGGDASSGSGQALKKVETVKMTEIKESVLDKVFIVSKLEVDNTTYSDF